MLRGVRALGFLTDLFASESEEKKITTPASASALSQKDIALITALKEKSALLKGKSEELMDAYNGVTPYYAVKNLLQVVKQIPLKRSLKSKPSIWTSPFPFGFFRIVSETYGLLDKDVDVIRQHAQMLAKEPYKRVYAARQDLKTAFKKAAEEYCKYCNDTYQKSPHKEAAQWALQNGNKIFSKYFTFSFDDLKYSIKEISVSPQETLQNTVEELNQLLNDVKEIKDSRPKKEGAFSAELSKALEYVQDEWKKNAILNKTILFDPKSKQAFSMSKEDSKADDEIVELLVARELIQEDYEDLAKEKELLGEIEYLTKLFQELKTNYEEQHDKEREALKRSLHNLAAEVKASGADLVGAATRLDTQLNSLALANRYKTYQLFKQTEWTVLALSIKINRRKSAIHNHFEELKMKLGGTAIEAERKEFAECMENLNKQLHGSLQCATHLKEKAEHTVALAALEKEYILKKIIRTLKKDTLNIEHLKNHWAKQVYTCFGIGGDSLTLKEEKKETKIKVPHGIAFMVRALDLLTDDVIDQMPVDDVLQLLLSFKQKIIEREEQRSSTISFSLFSCRRFEIAVRQDATIDLYQCIKGLDLERLLPNAETQFAFKNFNTKLIEENLFPAHPKFS